MFGMDFDFNVVTLQRRDACQKKKKHCEGNKDGLPE